MSGPCRPADGGRTWDWRRAGFPAIWDTHSSAPVERVRFDPADVALLIAIRPAADTTGRAVACDFLHLDAEGHRIRAREVAPLLTAMLAQETPK